MTQVIEKITRLKRGAEIFQSRVDNTKLLFMHKQQKSNNCDITIEAIIEAIAKNLETYYETEIIK